MKVVKAHKLPVEESLGYRVYSIVKKDISKLKLLIERQLVYYTVYAPYQEDILVEKEYKFQLDIIEVGQGYIEALKEVHENRNEVFNELRKIGEI